MRRKKEEEGKGDEWTQVCGQRPTDTRPRLPDVAIEACSRRHPRRPDAVRLTSLLSRGYAGERSWTRR